MKKLSTSHLVRLNQGSAKRKANRVLDKGLIGDLDVNGIHVVARHTLIDDGDTVRLYLLVKVHDRDDPRMAFLDVPLEDFNQLRDIG